MPVAGLQDRNAQAKSASSVVLAPSRLEYAARRHDDGSIGKGRCHRALSRGLVDVREAIGQAHLDGTRIRGASPRVDDGDDVVDLDTALLQERMAVGRVASRRLAMK